MLDKAYKEANEPQEPTIVWATINGFTVFLLPESAPGVIDAGVYKDPYIAVGLPMDAENADDLGKKILNALNDSLAKDKLSAENKPAHVWWTHTPTGEPKGRFVRMPLEVFRGVELENPHDPAARTRLDRILKAAEIASGQPGCVGSKPVLTMSGL